MIAEGDIDCEYLRMAAESNDLKPMWTLVSLRELEESKQGGDDVETYLRANPSVLRSRPLHAPVIVLRDWEDNDKKVNSVNSALGVHRHRSVSGHPRRSAIRSSARSSEESNDSSERRSSSGSWRRSSGRRASRCPTRFRSTRRTSTLRSATYCEPFGRRSRVSTSNSSSVGLTSRSDRQWVTPQRAK